MPDNRWVNERWQPCAVLPGTPAENLPAVSPEAYTVTQICDQPDRQQWRFDGLMLKLYVMEAEGYYANIVASNPSVFVAWVMEEDSSVVPAARPQFLTLSYDEAARILDGGGQIEAIPLPPMLHDWLLPFVQQHYRPEPRRKRGKGGPQKSPDAFEDIDAEFGE